MKLLKPLFALLIFASVTPALAQPAGYGIGTPFVTGTSVNDRAITSSSGRVAMGFLPQQSKTITEISVYVIETGTVASGDAVLDIYSSTSAGAPNASLASVVFDASSTGWKRVTFSQAVTAGTQYWFVLSNPNATGGNFFSIRAQPAGAVGPDLGGYGTLSLGRSGAALRQSGDSGSTWTSFEQTAASGYRVKFSDNSYVGYPYSNSDYSTNPIATGDRVYSAIEVANKFTAPAGGNTKFDCVMFNVGVAAGTPTGTIRYRLYDATSTTPIATTASSNVPLMGRGWLPLCFSSTQTLTAGTTYKLSVAETTQSDTSSNAYGPFRFDWDTDSNSTPLLPFNGTITKSVLNGTWADTAGSFYAMQIIPKPGAETECAASGDDCNIVSWNGTSVADLYDGVLEDESTTTLELSAGRVSADDQFNDGFAIVVYDVNGLVQARSCIADSVNTGDTVVTVKDISGLVAPGDSYIIQPDAGCAALRPTTPGVTLDVSGTGEAGVDFSNVGGTLDASEIGSNAITDAKIASAAFTSVKFADDFLTAAKIASAAVGTSEFAAEADINAEVVDALSTDTYGELSSCPTATASMTTMMRYIFALAKGKLIQNSSGMTVYKDDGSTVLCTTSTTNLGGLFTRNKLDNP